jgi:hypothetical protein
MTTPKPAPTSAPTEQDRKNAREAVVKSSIGKGAHSTPNVMHVIEPLLLDAIAAALQAERERE